MYQVTTPKLVLGDLSMEKDSGIDRKKICIDIAATSFVLIFAACFTWGSFFDPNFNSPIGSKHFPFYIWLSAADALPAVFGICWLIWRYSDAATKRVPFLKSKWFLVFLVFAVLTINTIRHTFGR